MYEKKAFLSSILCYSEDLLFQFLIPIDRGYCSRYDEPPVGCLPRIILILVVDMSYPNLSVRLTLFNFVIISNFEFQL